MHAPSAISAALATLAVALQVGQAAAGPATAPTHRPALPLHGVLVPGKSLAGVYLGDDVDVVTRRLGAFSRCSVCTRTTRLFQYENLLGLALTFDRDRKLTAVFTLGAPQGWQTRQGLRLGAPSQAIAELYGAKVRATSCTGYIAWSMRSGDTVTSIYDDGQSVYGFALTRPAGAICQ